GWLRPWRDDQRRGGSLRSKDIAGEMLPDLLSHKWHERVPEPQRVIPRGAPGLRRAERRSALAELRLRPLQIPVPLLRPAEVEDLPARLTELEALHQPCDLTREALRPADDPAVGERLGLKRVQRGNVCLHRRRLADDETRR